jgi:DNA-binding MarR family transcriptional regulator
MKNNKKIRLTHPSLLVLKAFMRCPADQLFGTEIMRETRLSSGTLYPILLRFESLGLLESEWESEKPQTMGRPRRRLYRITSEGREFARQALEQVYAPFLIPVPVGG